MNPTLGVTTTHLQVVDVPGGVLGRVDGFVPAAGGVSSARVLPAGGVEAHAQAERVDVVDRRLDACSSTSSSTKTRRVVVMRSSSCMVVVCGGGLDCACAHQTAKTHQRETWRGSAPGCRRRRAWLQGSWALRCERARCGCGREERFALQAGRHRRSPSIQQSSELQQ